MKTLNESFTDQEFKALRLVKDATNLNWHDFLLLIASHETDYLRIRDIWDDIMKEVKPK